jgi:hypothetical protein
MRISASHKPSTVHSPGRVMSPVAFAKQNLSKAKAISTLHTGRGGVDLLKNPAALAKLKVGELDAAKTRGGHLKNVVYKVLVAGPNDQRVDHVIVGVAVQGPDDRVSYKYFDAGVLASSKPNN